MPIRNFRYVVAALLVVAAVIAVVLMWPREAETPTPQQTVAVAPKQVPAPTVPLENIVLLELKDGTVEIEMLPNVAPNHVARIKELVRQGFYDGLKFHRVMEGFMAQTGDPLGNGTGGSGRRLNAEFNNERHVRGTVSMARTQDINGADSQFFIVLDDSLFLDRNYTVWGRVLRGMESVDQIKKGDPNRDGLVVDPDVIVSMRMKADAPAAGR